MSLDVPDWLEGPKRVDDDWVAAALRDMRAFAPLYARYYLPIYQYCRLRLDSAQEAEDATSETFERAMRNLRSYRGGSGGSFRSWLFSIAANHVRNAARDRRPTVPLPIGPDAPDLDPGACPEEAILALEQSEGIKRALAALPPGQQRVVELRLVGLTGREVAKVLGMSLTAVKVAQWRAFNRLQELLQEDDEDEDGTETPDA